MLQKHINLKYLTELNSVFAMHRRTVCTPKHKHWDILRGKLQFIKGIHVVQWHSKWSSVSRLHPGTYGDSDVKYQTYTLHWSDFHSVEDSKSSFGIDSTADMQKAHNESHEIHFSTKIHLTRTNNPGYQFILRLTLVKDQHIVSGKTVFAILGQMAMCFIQNQ